MAHPDFQIRGGGGGGGEVSNLFSRPLGPQFGLKIRGRAGPSPGSPTADVHAWWPIMTVSRATFWNFFALTFT